jgi:hypothetical protein
MIPDETRSATFKPEERNARQQTDEAKATFRNSVTVTAAELKVLNCS